MAGTLWGWGLNWNGELGIGTATMGPYAIRQISEEVWNDLSGGYNHVLAIRGDGTLWAWGSNGYGECGLGHKTTPVVTPTQVGSDSDWVMCSAGFYSSFAIKSNGAMYAWGHNEYYQLGLDGVAESADVVRPQLVNYESFSYVGAALRCTHAIDYTGNRWHCGSNAYGEAGQGNSGFYEGGGAMPGVDGIGHNAKWKQIEDGLLWVRVTGSKAATGGIGWPATALGIDEDSDGYGWGWNANGELGLDWGTLLWDTPQKVIDGPVADMSEGDAFSLAVKSDGTRWHTGYDGSNYSSYGDDEDCEEHVDMDEWLDCSDRAGDSVLWTAGKSFQSATLTLTRGGHLYLYGDIYDYGLKGDGTTSPEFLCVPTLIDGIDNVNKLAPTICSVLVLQNIKCRGNDMNPAHIIHECLTNKIWGMGYEP